MLDYLEALPQLEQMMPKMVRDQQYTGQFANVTISNMHYEYCDFSQIQLMGVNIENCVFRHCQFSEQQWECVRLTQVQFDQCHIANLRVLESQFYQVTIQEAAVEAAYLSQVQWDMVVWTDSEYQQLCLHNSELTHCTWSGCTGIDMHFDGVITRDMSWVNCQFETVNIQQSTAERWMTAQSKICEAQLHVLVAEQVRFMFCQLTNIRLSKCTVNSLAMAQSEIQQLSIHHCVLPYFALNQSQVQLGLMEHSDCTQALWDQAQLENCRFIQVQMPSSGLRKILLCDVQFVKVDLSRSDARGAMLDSVCFEETKAHHMILHDQRESDWQYAQTKGAQFKAPHANVLAQWRSHHFIGPRQEVNNV